MYAVLEDKGNNSKIVIKRRFKNRRCTTTNGVEHCCEVSEL